MASPRSLIGSVAFLSLFSPLALAQRTQPGDGNNNDNGDTPADDPTPTDDNNDEPTPTQDNNDDEEPTEDASPTPTNNNDDGDDEDSDSPVPTITGGNATPLGPGVSDLPTLTGFVDFSYPPPSVPPTVNAPFMQRSTMPNGTVFIAVGAILGTFGLAVLVWRAVVACLLHRSVERATQQQHLANEKSTFLAPPAAFYKNNERESSPSVAANGGKGVRRTTRGPTPSATPSQTNLFFSPTAAGSSAMGNRGSQFLPSGFYAAGSSPSPAHGHSYSMSHSNLRPDSRGQYSRNTMREPSPEGSPQLAVRRDPSMSSLNLNRPPSQRAPSAYLEDLLDDNPGMFPPNQMPPQAGGPPRHAHTFSHSSQGRY